MKKLFVLTLILISIIGSFATYRYFAKTSNIYSTSLPSNYDNFERDMFKVIVELKDEERDLLMNYSLRFRRSPSKITVREAIENEREFEKTNEGTIFFSQLKEKEEKQFLIDEVKGSVFITFVDFVVEPASINILFSIKNKSSETISYVSGDSYFSIGSDNFTTHLEFNTSIPPTATVQVMRKFNFSEFPALKDIKKSSSLRINIRQINFTNGESLLIK